jgi:hypothetical protein
MPSAFLYFKQMVKLFKTISKVNAVLAPTLSIRTPPPPSHVCSSISIIVLFVAARRPFRVTFRTDADETTATATGTAATDEVVKLYCY